MSIWKLVLVVAFGFGCAATAAPCTTQVEMRDVIGPATVDLLHRVEKAAESEQCSSILLLINTPGGALDSTRTIVETILNSPLPYLCLVAPSGGHAGSAGAIILAACHVNGALHGTNLGAATPVALGQDLPKDLRQKILNDTLSWMKSLTTLRERNERFGQDIVNSAKAVTAEDAVKLKAIDWAGDSVTDFIKFAEGRNVKLAGQRIGTVHTGPVQEFALDFRYHTLSLLTDPQFAYMLLLASLALIYFEITHTGVILPGVLGALGLVVAMIAMNKLEVEWAGVILIFLGAGMLAAEVFLPTFGVVGIGGVVALFLGSLFLFDPVKTGGYRLPMHLITPVVVFFALVILGISFLLLRTRRIRKKGGFEDLLGLEARVVRVASESARQGYIELRGETWQFEAPFDVSLNQTVKVVGYRGLVLQVQNKENL